MKPVTFVITYSLYHISGKIDNDKEMKVKNCMGELHAKVKLNEYLKSKIKDFDYIIIHTCKEDRIGDFLRGFGSSGGNPFDFLGDIFGGTKK